MIRFAADENFNNDILRGLQRLHPDVDIVRVQDTEMYKANDPKVLAWAAKENRILLTHDANTMTKFAYDRILSGLPMPGIFVMPDQSLLGKVIEDLAMVVGASEAAEWEGKVTFIPLR